ncbi:MAG: DUF4147 domain-containing protein [bacterium]
MNFNYLKIIQSVPLNFSNYSAPVSDEIILSIGKSGSFMYKSFIKTHPDTATLPKMLIVPKGVKVDLNLEANTLYSTHPHITKESFSACNQLLSFIKKNNPKKITVLLSGGSSALIEKSNSPEKTMKENAFLLKSGLNIVEMNEIRSKNSAIKNGKLAKLFPHVYWEVFVMSDIPFENGEKFVGSMPFYSEELENTALFKCADSNTLHDHIISSLDIKNVRSIRNYTGTVDELSKTVTDFIKNSSKNLIVTGEPTLKIDSLSPGIGGRMSHLALKTLPFLNKNISFCALSSDGIDGSSNFAGVILEGYSFSTLKADEIEASLNAYDSATFFAKLKMVLKTGYTEINLNDFVVMMRS